MAKRQIYTEWDEAPAILTTAQAAALLQTTDRTIKQMIYDKRLPAAKVGRAWRIEKSEVRKLFLKGKK